MKYTIINDTNMAKIMQAFDTAQGRATARTIGSAADLTRIIKGVEDRLHPMAKKAMDGTKVHYDYRQEFPRAYKFRPESTHFDLIYSKGSWRIDLDSIKRFYTPNINSLYGYYLELSETAKEAILDRYK